MPRLTRSRAASAPDPPPSPAAASAASKTSPASPAADAAPAAALAASASAASVEPCVICLEDLLSSAPYASLDQCDHRFHPECILHWSGVTNLCPLCKARFKHVREVDPSTAAAAAVGHGNKPRAGLRDRSAKVVRVATRNQVVEWSDSSDEGEGEEQQEEREERPRRATRRRVQASSRRTTASRPPAHHSSSSSSSAAAAPCPTRSTRARSRVQESQANSSDDEEYGPSASSSEDEEEGEHDDQSDEEYKEAEAASNLADMTEEEQLAYALRESLKLSSAAPSASAASSSSRRPPRSRSTRAQSLFSHPAPRRTRRRNTSVEVDEDDAHMAESKPARRGRARREVQQQAEHSHVSPAPSSTAAAGGDIQWIRTKNGRWARTRAASVNLADELIAQHRAAADAEQRAFIAAAHASASSSTSSSSAASTSSSIRPSSSLLAPVARAAQAAEEASSSFEQRIAAHRNAKASRAAQPAAHIIDRTDELSSTSAAQVSSFLTPPSLFSSSDLSAPLEDDGSSAAGASFVAEACVPGGLQVWRRRSGAPRAHAEECKEQESEQEGEHSEQENDDSAPSSPIRQLDSHIDENSVPLTPVPSLWSRVSSFLSSAIGGGGAATPGKASEVTPMAKPPGGMQAATPLRESRPLQQLHLNF